jgi:hypothetical protein
VLPKVGACWEIPPNVGVVCLIADELPKLGVKAPNAVFDPNVGVEGTPNASVEVPPPNIGTGLEPNSNADDVPQLLGVVDPNG